MNTSKVTPTRRKRDRAFHTTRFGTPRRGGAYSSEVGGGGFMRV
jgi:hypothetical protein